MDGWETRRKRKKGFDYLIVKLGKPGKIFSADIDTTHFSGNQPNYASLEACFTNKNLNYKSGDVFGFSGIEKMYESLLRGKDGTEFRLVDIYGIDHGINGKNPGFPSIPGKALNLTINSELQSFIEGLFNEKIVK